MFISQNRQGSRMIKTSFLPSNSNSSYLNHPLLRLGTCDPEAPEAPWSLIKEARSKTARFNVDVDVFHQKLSKDRQSRLLRPMAKNKALHQVPAGSGPCQARVVRLGHNRNP